MLKKELKIREYCAMSSILKAAQTIKIKRRTLLLNKKQMEMKNLEKTISKGVTP